MVLKNLLLFAAILFFIKSVPVYPQQDRWRKIKPIESKLSDVEAILGKAEKTEHRVTYALDEGVYSILYSYGPCELEMDWKVPEWTVIEVFYRPYDDLKLSILGINLKKLKKESNKYSHTPGILEYTDEYNGITYSVQRYAELKTGVVTTIQVKPGKKYNHLICKKKGNDLNKHSNKIRPDATKQPATTRRATSRRTGLEPIRAS